MVGMQVQYLFKDQRRPSQIAQFLQYNTKTKEPVVVLWIQRQRALKVIQRRSKKALHVKRCGTRVPPFCKIGGVIGQGGQVFNGNVQLTVLRGFTAPAQKHIQSRAARLRPRALDLAAEAQSVGRPCVSQGLKPVCQRGLRAHRYEIRYC